MPLLLFSSNTIIMRTTNASTFSLCDMPKIKREGKNKSLGWVKMCLLVLHHCAIPLLWKMLVYFPYDSPASISSLDVGPVLCASRSQITTAYILIQECLSQRAKQGESSLFHHQKDCFKLSSINRIKILLNAIPRASMVNTSYNKHC